MIKLFYCEDCKKAKEWPSMHSEFQCKNCWAKDYTEKYEKGSKKTWITRRENK